MTYCVAIKLEEGLVFASDSRTNAGVDQVSTYSKMHTFETEGERLFMVLTAGNLATTQAVINRLKREMEEGIEGSFGDASHMSEAAEYLGRVNREEQEKHSEALSKSGIAAEATLIIGGQIRGDEPEIYRVYPQGNYITTSTHTPFLQIGESKYGKPVLDRIASPGLTLEEGGRLLLVSLDATSRSNITVGPPYEVGLYRSGDLALHSQLRFGADDPFLRDLQSAWQAGIGGAFRALPRFEWEQEASRLTAG